MRHVIVSRFSVPRLDAATADTHRDPAWLDSRLDLFRRYFVPSVGRLGVPVVLLCSSDSAARVADATRDLDWCSIVEQNGWNDGWRGAGDHVVTRLDSDDGLHEGWFAALETAEGGHEVYGSRSFLRFHPESGRLYERSRRKPCPLAAFPGGRNPYAVDHADLLAHYRVHLFEAAYLLQIVHDGNLSNRRPSWRHFPFRVPLDRLAPFGLKPGDASG